ncbi:MAG: molybdopterin-dependent oxidoreductase [Alphaproteobacteria bacterium]|nr:molybdopterin-dependent oxidoreductase [Alphaproteobacteria bacterium]
MYGGVVQGIGQAFTENLVYERGSGQLLSGSLMDYGLPRADQVCPFEMEENPVPTKTNALGVKGAGEAQCRCARRDHERGRRCARTAWDTHIDMPGPPEKVWRAIRTVHRT